MWEAHHRLARVAVVPGTEQPSSAPRALANNAIDRSRERLEWHCEAEESSSPAAGPPVAEQPRLRLTAPGNSLVHLGGLPAKQRGYGITLPSTMKGGRYVRVLVRFRELTPDEETELQRLVVCRKAPMRLVKRAQDASAGGGRRGRA